MNKRPSDRYLKIVEWSEEDRCYVGTCPGLMHGGVHGANEAKVYKDLCKAVDDVIALYRKDGKPLPQPTAGKTYSGEFRIRIKPEIHKALAVRALVHGESLNDVCSKALERVVKYEV